MGGSVHEKGAAHTWEQEGVVGSQSTPVLVTEQYTTRSVLPSVSDS